jgi:hypothetical protein
MGRLSFILLAQCQTVTAINTTIPPESIGVGKPSYQPVCAGMIDTPGPAHHPCRINDA